MRIGREGERLGMPGMSGVLSFSESWDARDEAGLKLPDSRELDATLDFRIAEGSFRGLWFRVRASWLDEDGNADAATEFRLILRYDFPLI